MSSTGNEIENVLMLIFLSLFQYFLYLKNTKIQQQQKPHDLNFVTKNKTKQKTIKKIKLNKKYVQKLFY